MMTLNRRILISCGWILGCLILGGALTIWAASQAPTNAKAQARAASAGTATAIVVSVGCGVLWLPWAARVGREKRAERENAAVAGRRPRRSQRR